VNFLEAIAHCARRSHDGRWFIHSGALGGVGGIRILFRDRLGATGNERKTDSGAEEANIASNIPLRVLQAKDARTTNHWKQAGRPHHKKSRIRREAAF